MDERVMVRSRIRSGGDSLLWPYCYLNWTEVISGISYQPSYLLGQPDADYSYTLPTVVILLPAYHFTICQRLNFYTFSFSNFPCNFNPNLHLLQNVFLAIPLHSTTCKKFCNFKTFSCLVFFFFSFLLVCLFVFFYLLSFRISKTKIFKSN